jgi:nucleotide-binding universal stress UspA family protein
MERIVVGVDGSDESKNALRWAADEARAHGALLVALLAYEAPPIPLDISPTPRLDIVGASTEVYEAALGLVTRVAEEVLGDDSTVQVESIAVEGSSPESVLIEASRDASLLVVGTGGDKDLDDRLLGSVSLECAQHAACPVVLHRRS